MRTRYNESRLKELSNEYVDECIAEDKIPYRIGFANKLGVTRHTVLGYSKKYPNIFEDLDMWAKKMIVKHALEGKMKHDKALFILMKNYNIENICGIVPKRIRFTFWKDKQIALVAFGRGLGMEIDISG